MDQETLRQELLGQALPLVGGQANIARREFRSGTLYITLKDQGLADLDGLRGLSGVTGAELSRGKLKLALTELYFEEERKMADNKKIASDILAAIGGKENVTAATHCMTRLRLNLKDPALAPEETVKNIPGVLGVVQTGGQFQIIVGQNVPKVYAEFCSLTGIAVQATVNENLDAPKEKLTPKKVGSNIMNYLSGSMAMLIPAMIGVAMFKTVQVVVGPDMLGLVTADSSFYLLCTIIYNSFFYFLPVFLGYSAAKKLGCSQLLGMLCGAMLLVPEFTALVDTDFNFTVYGIPAPVANYGQTIVPALLAVFLISYIEKFFKKIIPDVLSTIFVPFLSLVVIVPINFCLLAPLGSRLGDVLGNGLLAFGNVGGFLAVAVVAALWEFLVMTGMHGVLIMFAIGGIFTNGVDNFVLVAGGIATWAAYGMALGAFLRLKNKDEKALSLGYFISGFLGGVTEPTLYGTGMKYKRPFIALLIGGFIGGLYAGITHVGVYVMGATNLLGVLGFVAGGTANLVNGIIASVAAMLISAACTFLFGFSKDDLKA